MIELIKVKVEMPDIKKYKVDKIKNRWCVVDTENNDSIRYKGFWEDCMLACHNLNKKHYLDLKNKN
jgi:hypothetical protein